MDLKYLVISIAILLSTSNTFLKHFSTPGSIVERTTLFQPENSFFDVKNEASFENEEFISNALENNTIAKLNGDYVRFLKCSKESVINRHDSAIIDTVYTFSNRTNKIQIYRSKQKDIIFTFDITDSKIILTGNIKTGMSKDIFSKKFQITKNTKVIIVKSKRIDY